MVSITKEAIPWRGKNDVFKLDSFPSIKSHHSLSRILWSLESWDQSSAWPLVWREKSVVNEIPKTTLFQEKRLWEVWQTIPSFHPSSWIGPWILFNLTCAHFKNIHFLWIFQLILLLTLLLQESGLYILSSYSSRKHGERGFKGANYLRKRKRKKKLLVLLVFLLSNFFPSQLPLKCIIRPTSSKLSPSLFPVIASSLLPLPRIFFTNEETHDAGGLVTKDWKVAKCKPSPMSMWAKLHSPLESCTLRNSLLDKVSFISNYPKILDCPLKEKKKKAKDEKRCQ